MKPLYNILFKLLFILLLTANYLDGASNMCYEKPVKKGICLGILSIGCTTTTTIRNTSDSTITDASIVHAFYGLELGLINGIGIDGSPKTTKKDGDTAEVSGALSDLTRLGGLVDLNLFGKGIVYRTDDYAKGATHNVYYKNLLSLNISADAYLATYKIDGIEHKEKLSLCADYTIDNPRDFTEIFRANISGNMKIIGNSILCKKNGSNCSEPDGGKNNNDLNTIFYKLPSDSSDPSIVNSTSYTFTLPSGVAKESILWAGLYWQAGIKGTASSDDMDAVQTIKLKAPGDASYRLITAETHDNRFNWIKNTTSTSAMYYQGVKEITPILKSAGAGTYQVANINNISNANNRAYGDKYTPGHFGGWAMVIVYEDPNDTLKNITIYDGFDAVSKNKSVTANLSGFLTPSNGAVNSSFMVFGSEGDIGYKKDKISITNKSNTKYYLKSDGTASKTSGNYNPMDSSITKTGSDIRTPNYGNTIGIDIKTYNVGTGDGALGIIMNEQTSTTITLSTGDDVYNPGVFAFSTQLYAPEVCYYEDVFLAGKKIDYLTKLSNGDELEYEVTITNEGNESAKGVLIEKRFEKLDEIKYVANSMWIKPISGVYSKKTDAIDGDTAEYSAGIAKFSLGNIEKNKITNFKYNAEVGNQNVSQNTYFLSYRNDQLDITFNELPLSKCVDFNNSFGVYIPVAGSFNTVRSGAITSGEDPIEPLDEKNALYTQIVNKPFDVDVISLDSNNKTLKNWSGDLNLSIVEFPAGAICEGATLLLQVGEAIFTNQNLYTFNISPTIASKNAVFRMQTDSVTVCSRDSFAIRPASYTMDANDTTLIGKKEYTFDIKAVQNTPSTQASLGYTQSIHNGVDKNATTQLNKPASCTLTNPLEYTNIPIAFVDGEKSVILKYSDIGDVNLTITDNNWAEVDRDKGDCVAESFSNDSSEDPDGKGRVGCMLKSVKTFKFVPNKFTNELSIANSGVGFTYLSNDKNMSAIINLTTTARLYDAAGNDNLTATNYTKDCFAKNVQTTISLVNNKALSWNDTQNRIKFYDDNNITSTFLNQATQQATFVSSEGNFTNGVAPLTFKFNFERNSTKEDTPFTIARNDFNITSIADSDARAGSDFNRSVDLNATFIYGRTHASKQRYSGSSGTAFIYYEAYCFGASCDKSLLPDGVNSKNTNDLRWFRNTQHTPNDGVVGSVTQKNAAKVEATLPTDANPAVTTITYDESSGYPYSTTMKNNASSWLIHSEHNADATTNEFSAEFSTAGNWSGKHEIETTTKDLNVTKTNRRSMW